MQYVLHYLLPNQDITYEFYSDVSSRSFQMESEIIIGVWVGGASTSFCNRRRAGGVDYSQKFMKPALLAGAKKQSAAALALLAKAASV